MDCNFVFISPRQGLGPRVLPELSAVPGGYPFQVEFVVSSPRDLAEIEAVVFGVDATILPWRIQLTPEGT